MSKRKLAALVCLSASALLGGCSQGPTVSFRQDVKPILDKYCVECHADNGEGVEASGFRVDSYDAVMKGTNLGPVVVAGDSASSSLYRLVAGKVDPSIQMPHGKQSLSEAEVMTVERWIDQGAKDN
jgi:hypothetical protein